MTSDQLSAIRERLDAVPPGPWELWYGELDWVSVGIDGDTVAECRTHINQQFSGWQNLRNATFIQHAPTDLAALLDEVERLTTLLAGTEAVLENEREYQARLKAEVGQLANESYRRGVAAMREAAASYLAGRALAWGANPNMEVVMDMLRADEVRALPDPEDKP